MQRVLSFQMARSMNESSEYVTKRLCFSFLFSVGFLCLFCGFLLGRFATERSMEAQAQKTRAELAGNGLWNTEYLQQLTLRELARATFDHVTYVQLSVLIVLDDDVTDERNTISKLDQSVTRGPTAFLSINNFYF